MKKIMVPFVLLLSVNASAKRIHIPKAVNSDQIKLELAAKGVEANLENCAIGDPSKCFVVCDDKADSKVIAAVVAAHVPKPVVTRASLVAEISALRLNLKSHQITPAEMDRLSEAMVLLYGE